MKHKPKTVNQLKEELENKILTGTKYDKNKPQLGLVPVEAMEAIARAMEYGIDKYSRGNWVNVEPERYINACLRHIYACQTPEGYNLTKTDEESGLKHLDHAITNLAFVLHNTTPKQTFTTNLITPIDLIRKTAREVYDNEINDGLLTEEDLYGRLDEFYYGTFLTFEAALIYLFTLEWVTLTPMLKDDGKLITKEMCLKNKKYLQKYIDFFNDDVSTLGFCYSNNMLFII